MTDKPILFSGPMVRALLEGRKNQTRRVVKPQPAEWRARVIDITEPFFLDEEGCWGQVRTDWDAAITEPQDEVWVPLKGIPYATGDRLWVRECFTLTQHDKAVYRADATDQTGQRWHSIAPGDPEKEVRWKPSIFMPRWASRLTLTVTDVRVQRLQEISTDDAKSEGIPEFAEDAGRIGLPAVSGIDGCEWDNRSSVENFRLLWDSLNAKRGYGWDANPWVSAYTFTVHRQNIDQMERAA